MGKNNTPYIVSFYKQQKNKKKGIKVVLQEDWYPVATGYVYKWTFELDGKTWYYIGYHSIKIDEKKFYDFSSEVVEMRDLYSNEKCQKTVEVLHWGTAEQMKKKEEELLEDVKHRFWNKPGGDYFNQKIQYLSGNQISGVNLSTVEQVNKELEILKDRRTDKYSELKILSDSLIQEDYSAKELSEMDNLQVREVSKIQKLISELQYMIQTKIDNQQDIKDGSKCVVILEDRDFKLDNKTNHWDKVLICGKHTSDAYGGDGSKWSSYAKLDVIAIPKEIHKDWNDMEVWKIANGDNEKNNSIEPITKDDIVREYQVMVDNNLDWQTDDEHNRVKKLLRSKGAWNYIKTQMEDYAMDKQRLSQGLGPRISWSTKSNSHRVQLEAQCVTKNGGSDDFLIEQFIENDIPPLSTYHKGPHTTEIVNPYVQVFGPLNKKFMNYCSKNNISDKKLNEYIRKFFEHIKEIKYYLYFPNPEAKRKFNSDDSHRTQIFGIGSHFLIQSYDYEILPEFEKSITT
mgnify:FL=1